MGLVSLNVDRQLIHSGKLLEVKLENISNHQLDRRDKPSTYITQPCYCLLFNDCFIIVKSTNIRTATAYDVDQVIKMPPHSNNRNDNNQYPSSLLQIINVKDDVIRNSFLIRYNLDTITMMCDNAQIKKQWIEMFESALYTDPKQFSSKSASVQSEQEQTLEEEFVSEQWITDLQENLTILLAERRFHQALTLILQAKKYTQQFLSQHEQQSVAFIDRFTKNLQEKEQELTKLIEKEIAYISERGCSTNLLKHYYQHVEILKQLGYIPKAW